MIVNLDCQFDMIWNYPRKPISADVGERLSRKTHVTVGGTISRTMVLENQKKNEAEYQCASLFTS